MQPIHKPEFTQNFVKPT